MLCECEDDETCVLSGHFREKRAVDVVVNAVHGLEYESTPARADEQSVQPTIYGDVISNLHKHASKFSYDANAKDRIASHQRLEHDLWFD